MQGEGPSGEEIHQIREIVTRRLAEEAAEEYDQVALGRVHSDSAYVTSFFKHVFDNPGAQVEEAASMILRTLKWRQEQGAGGLGEADFPPGILERGTLFARNRDRDGRKLLVFCVGKHIKGTEKMEDMKKFFVYYMERLAREDYGEQFSIVFDCRGAGLKNMDMEFTQFMINTMKDFYPDPLNYILVFEMPWVLNAAFKIIKAWLPPAAVKKIKFLTKSNMSEYVDDENRLEAWGGQDSWEYKWEPENKLSNGVEARKKTVTFAGSALAPSNSADSLGSALSSGSSGPAASGQPGPQQGPQGTDLLRLTPPQEVVFSPSQLGDLTGKVTLSNTSGRPLGYKIKTTSPEKYRVRPSTGSLASGQSVTVEIHVSSSQAKEPSTLLRDKFLVTAVLLDREDTPGPQLAEALRTTAPDGQYRLRCQLAGVAGEQNSSQGPAPVYSSHAIPTSPPQPEDPVRQVAIIGRKVAQLVEGQEQISSQLRQLRLLLLLTLATLLLLLLTLFWYLPSCDSSMQILNDSQSKTNEPANEDVVKTEL